MLCVGNNQGKMTCPRETVFPFCPGKVATLGNPGDPAACTKCILLRKQPPSSQKLAQAPAFWNSAHTKLYPTMTAPFLRDLEELTAFGIFS